MDLSTHEGEIPIPISSTYVSHQTHHSHSHGHSLVFENHPHPPPPPLTIPTIDQENASFKRTIALATTTSSVKYRECLKNHAASIGGNATDGCGEFMPSGEEGTLEALKCSACNCHRNFHRKEIEGHELAQFKGGRKLIGGVHKGLLFSSTSDSPHGYNNNNNLIIPRPTPHNMIMPIASESDEMEGIGGGYPRPPMLRKRFRTKFSTEQKEKMLAFAEKVGWKLQRQEEGVVQQFCQEIGVKRRVLKVWMHNNKHNYTKKPALGSSLDERMEGMNE